MTALESHIRRVERRLTEEEILISIHEVTYHFNPNETSTQNQTCTICQVRPIICFIYSYISTHEVHNLALTKLTFVFYIYFLFMYVIQISKIVIIRDSYLFSVVDWKN